MKKQKMTMKIEKNGIKNKYNKMYFKLFHCAQAIFGHSGDNAPLVSVQTGTHEHTDPARDDGLQN